MGFAKTKSCSTFSHRPLSNKLNCHQYHHHHNHTGKNFPDRAHKTYLQKMPQKVRYFSRQICLLTIIFPVNLKSCQTITITIGSPLSVRWTPTRWFSSHRCPILALFRTSMRCSSSEEKHLIDVRKHCPPLVWDSLQDYRRGVKLNF